MMIAIMSGPIRNRPAAWVEEIQSAWENVLQRGAKAPAPERGRRGWGAWQKKTGCESRSFFAIKWRTPGWGGHPSVRRREYYYTPCNKARLVTL